MALFIRKFAEAFDKISENLEKTFRSYEENFKNFKEICEKKSISFEENLRKSRESLENCGENYTKFSGNIKNLRRKF